MNYCVFTSFSFGAAVSAVLGAAVSAVLGAAVSADLCSCKHPLAIMSLLGAKGAQDMFGCLHQCTLHSMLSTLNNLHLRCSHLSSICIQCYIRSNTPYLARSRHRTCLRHIWLARSWRRSRQELVQYLVQLKALSTHH